MNKHVFFARPRYETVPFGIVEPLDGSLNVSLRQRSVRRASRISVCCGASQCCIFVSRLRIHFRSSMAVDRWPNARDHLPATGGEAGCWRSGAVCLNHIGTEGDTPASVYQPSPRPPPRTVPPLEYPAHFEVRLVSRNSGIRWNRHWVCVTHTLAGEYVGLEEVDDGLWTCRSAHRTRPPAAPTRWVTDKHCYPCPRTLLLPIFPAVHATTCG